MNAAINDAEGRAYGKKPGKPDLALTQVGPGTLGGELLRRYWQPIAMSYEATSTPKQIQRLGEELILFRNGQGEVGLLTPRCIHRGTTLYYGKVEEDGIRCCYHGWKFGCQGQVLDQPCEPDGGERTKHKLRQPWYPVIEKWGAIWAYMGPADKQPLFPIYSAFEDLADDEEIIADYMNAGGELTDFPARYNWFQHFDNAMDHFHIQVLHLSHAGTHFTDRRWDAWPEAKWNYSDSGDSVLTHTRRDLGNGEAWMRIEQALMPNVLVIPPFYGDGVANHLWFFVPWDDTTYVQVQVIRQKKGFVWTSEEVAGYGPDNKLWRDMTPEEHRAFPSDHEAQEGQGITTLHTDEHLASSDEGIVKQRLLYKRAAKKVAAGEDPPGVAFTEAERRIVIEARSWMETIDQPATENA